MAERGYESGRSSDLLSTWQAVFERQRAFAEHAFDQLDDAGFFATPAAGINSVAVIARHLGGNMLSRWMDFLASDGEKPDRDRDAELAPFAVTMSDAERASARAEVMRIWEAGWQALFAALDGLGPDDLDRTVTIRGAPHAVHAAIARQLDHYAFHVGQINVIARMHVGSDAWRWFTLPPGGTRAFNDAMRERHGG